MERTGGRGFERGMTEEKEDEEEHSSKWSSK